jgi:uncharacterized alkaline shock family protein YloU
MGTMTTDRSGTPSGNPGGEYGGRTDTQGRPGAPGAAAGETGRRPGAETGTATTGPETGAARGTQAGGRELAGTGGDTALATARGRTSISDAVVRKIAGVATREVDGVHDLGTGGSRTVGSIRQRIPGSSGPNVSRGVSVEVGQRQAAIDLDVVVDYGVSIIDISRAVRGNVISSVEGMTGLEVTEVNVDVDDVFLPDEDDQNTARVE